MDGENKIIQSIWIRNKSNGYKISLCEFATQSQIYQRAQEQEK